MKKRDRWTIDADIVRSAGETEHPISSSSRKLLDHVYASGAKIILNQLLLNEWKKHMSVYSNVWFGRMLRGQKGRVKKVDDDYSFEAKIDNSDILSEKQKEAAKKDCHLINASFNNGKTIASNDNVAREIFCLLSSRAVELRYILWVTPGKEADRIIRFSKEGKKADPEWHIKPNKPAR